MPHPHSRHDCWHLRFHFFHELGHQHSGSRKRAQCCCASVASKGGRIAAIWSLCGCSRATFRGPSLRTAAGFSELLVFCLPALPVSRLSAPLHIAHHSPSDLADVPSPIRRSSAAAGPNASSPRFAGLPDFSLRKPLAAHLSPNWFFPLSPSLSPCPLRPRRASSALPLSGRQRLRSLSPGLT